VDCSLIGLKSASDDHRQEPDHDLRPERRRDLRCRVQNGCGRGARDLNPKKRGRRDPAFSGANALRAVCAGRSVRNLTLLIALGLTAAAATLATPAHAVSLRDCLRGAPCPGFNAILRSAAAILWSIALLCSAPAILWSIALLCSAPAILRLRL